MSKKFCDFLINILFVKNCQLGFSSKIKVPQLGLTRLGTFTARARSSRKIPAQTHHYCLALVFGASHHNITDSSVNK